MQYTPMSYSVPPPRSLVVRMLPRFTFIRVRQGDVDGVDLLQTGVVLVVEQVAFTPYFLDTAFSLVGSLDRRSRAPQDASCAWRGQTGAAPPPEQCDPVPRLRTGPRRFDVIAFGPRSRVFANAVLTSCREISPREDRATMERGFGSTCFAGRHVGGLNGEVRAAEAAFHRGPV